jgi:hypothetical protein
VPGPVALQLLPLGGPRRVDAHGSVAGSAKVRGHSTEPCRVGEDVDLDDPSAQRRPRLTTVDKQHWRAAINMILYGHQSALDDQAVDTTARRLIARRIFRDPPQDYYDVIKHALGLNVPLNDGISRHSQEETRRFFEELLSKLDHYRPWPEPPYVRQDVSLWGQSRWTPPFASIDDTKQGVSSRLWEPLDRLPGTARDRYGLMLRLRGGRLIAFLAPPDITDRGVEIVQAGQGDPLDALTDFLAATGYGYDQVTTLQSGANTEESYEASRTGEITLGSGEADAFPLPKRLMRLLLGRADAQATEPTDAYLLQQAVDRNILRLDLDPRPSGRTLRRAVALQAGCREVRRILGPSDDPTDRTSVALVHEIETRLAHKVADLVRGEDCQPVRRLPARPGRR